MNEEEKNIRLDDLENENSTINDPIGDNEELRDVGFNPKDIDIAIKQLPLYSIIQRIKTGRINMNTEFQRRGELWSSYYQSRLIESILLTFPLPSFYFDASDDDDWLVVDGLQRLSTLKRFVIDKQLKLSGLEVLKEFNGYKYDDLPISMTSRIDEFQVTVYLIKPGTPKEIKYEVFNRINTGGLTLTSQEIRHALNQGDSAEYLRSFVYTENRDEDRYNDEYINYINVNDKRMGGRELILRYIAFYRNHWDTYKPSLLNFLNEEMESLESLTEDEKIEIKNDLWKACRVIKELFGEHAFSKSILEPSTGRRIVNSSLFEIWTSTLAKVENDKLNRLLDKKKEIIYDFKRLLEDSEFNNAISISTSSRKNVHTRFRKIEELINNR